MSKQKSYRFDAYLMVDWSARATAAPRKPARDAIWYCWRHGEEVQVRYCRTRQQAEAEIRGLLAQPLRILAGFDFSFCYPVWFLKRLGLDWASLWERLDGTIEDSPSQNNRFEVAADLNRQVSGQAYPFWGTPRPQPFLYATKPYYPDAEFRACELALTRRPCSSFKLYTAGSVGSQTLLGIPMLNRFRKVFGQELSVWPFQEPTRRIVLAEIYPSLIPREPDAIPDRAQVRACARYFAEAPVPWPACPEQHREEGWILGATLGTTR